MTHKSFGRGKIVESGTDSVTVQFKRLEERKRFIYPSAIETFLVLEDAETAQQFKKLSVETADYIEAEQKAAAERLLLEKNAILAHAKAMKKALKKPAKTKKNEE